MDAVPRPSLGLKAAALPTVLIPVLDYQHHSETLQDNHERPSLPDRIPPRVPDCSPPPAPRSGPSSRPSSSSRKLQKAESPGRWNTIPPAVSPMAQHHAEAAHGRSVSSPVTTRPISLTLEGAADSPGGKISKRRSWLAGGRRSRATSQEDPLQHRSNAWINAENHQPEYSLSPLVSGEKVPELWNESSDTFIYLYPQATGRGSSFRVPSMALASSAVLLNYLHGDPKVDRGRSFDGGASLSAEHAIRNMPIRGLGTPPYTPKSSVSETQSNIDCYDDFIQSFDETPHEMHLYFPTGLTTDGTNLAPQDVQTLVDVRNLFAFLMGQPLVATRGCNSTFQIFLSVGLMLWRYGFANIDGSTFGESATASFEFYLDSLQLADVRTNPEKTIEALVLGESMRSADLYTEAFTHAVGNYNALKESKYQVFEQISPATRANLERSSLELVGRQDAADSRLADFNFPSLFAGIAASTSREESRHVRFKAWKSNFMSMRKHVLSYYKSLHGQWPPKASSKKNSFAVGGLNRLVLKGLYADMCSLYNLRADRSLLTTRSYDSSKDGEQADVDPTTAALRTLLSEFDRSSPPVQPPIPFDVPLIPSVSSIDAKYPSMSPKAQLKLATRRLKHHESQLVLLKTRNVDADHPNPFLDMYKIFEDKESRGKNVQELSDQVYGHWIFLYAVIQSLPLLAVDVPGLRYTEGVEYFLCSAPSGSLPWVEDAPKTAWYGVQGGQHVVSLPSHLVDNGVEAVYRRSHCWAVAEKWIGNVGADGFQSANLIPDQEQQLSPLAPPPGFAGGELGMRPQSRGRSAGVPLDPESLSALEKRSRSRQSQRLSIALGLERLPIPSGLEDWNLGSRGTSPVVPHSARRDSSMNSVGTPRSATSISGTTFDQILGNISAEDTKGNGVKK
ncbi:uncharacterized protein BP5553_04385 [Venustampulla echinocandica]|uniref:DUF8004 domain-containing protein n=1 Tax=Venustampulla echinocandica TaxID=2656787 RepID=A0A370TN57_9HELO|nr:uncharacterized protein BP5553_04385 [Venustampulla echinocandica]RDL36952.1 hypothetical protein BP5553_04385 [Venustampulla echinocandica]